MTGQPLATGRVIRVSLAYGAGVAAVASYLQALTVVRAADGPGLVSYFVAGLADPAVFAASANILDASRKRARLPRWSIVSIAVALLATLGANIFASDPAAVPPWLVRVWPPVAFLMALESLMSYTRRGRGAVASPAPGSPATPSHCGHVVSRSGPDVVRAMFEHARDCDGEPLTFVELAAGLASDRKKVAAMVKGGEQAAPGPSANGQGPHGG